YGLLLAIKLACVVTALGLGAYHARQAATRARQAGADAVSTSLYAELGFAALALAATALLAGTPLPGAYAPLRFLPPGNHDAIGILGVEIHQRNKCPVAIHADRRGLRDRRDLPARRQQDRIPQAAHFARERQRAVRRCIRRIIQRAGDFEMRAL